MLDQKVSINKSRHTSLFLFIQIQEDCTSLIKENAALAAQVVELRKQIDAVS